MKMIDVLNMVAKGEIKDKTILDVYDHTGDIYTYTFDEEFKAFYDEYDNEMAGDFEISNKFLNYEVDLIPPKEKKYLVKFNMRWWIERFSYLNYYEKNESIELNTKQSSVFCKASFTKDELQSIQPVREFLEDMEGKYELIEVEENEID
ncbi:hypothetical protein V4S36_11390 [Enterococcus cecorum]|uniref:hypothetical protein n=1 Tax=Enterococcus cecorum TaxID=44008 RepID=UPI003267ED6D